MVIAVNPLVILGFVILGLVLLAAVFVPLMWCIWLFVVHEEGPWPVRRIAIAVGAFVLAVTVSIWVLGTLIPISDGSEHCGPGTHYVATGSGKYRSWICVAS